MWRSLRAFFLSGILAMSMVIFAFPTTSVYAADFSKVNASSGAQGIIFAGICDDPASSRCTECRNSGNCTLNDLLQVFVNIGTFVLGISGSVVLFVFMYGGFKWLFSRGEGKWIQEGKDAMTGAAIGLMIIFGSYVALNFIISGLTTKSGTPTSGDLEDTVIQGIDSEVKPAPVFTTE
ncbi:MAG: hypothetical protein WCT28_00710 [Patescibacteria group bacterium]|jgi:hypothetical protein